MSEHCSPVGLQQGCTARCVRISEQRLEDSLGLLTVATLLGQFGGTRRFVIRILLGKGLHDMEAKAMSILDWYEVIGITLLLGERAVGYYRGYRQSRFVEPKLQTQRVFLEQAKWLNDRAQKLAAFRWQLRNTNPDKFKLAELVSKLDRHDQQFAMKETDIDALSKWAEQKGQECHDNADQASRWAQEVVYRILAD